MTANALLNEHASCGRLDQPPHEACYIRLPDSFGRRFTILVDTEEEFDWGKPPSREERATRAMRAMPRMHERMRAAGAKPVYLVDYPIATDPNSIDLLCSWLERGECTIGTQLHPWVNPPFDEEVNQFNSFTGNLPVGLQHAKLEVLTMAIAEAFGQRPIVYRAGRYGVGPDTARLLEDAGYKVDVSVRPLFDYSAAGGPNFAQVRPQPYWVGDHALLEVPLGAAFTGRLRKRGGGVFPKVESVPRMRSLLSRSGLLKRIALTPEDMPLPDVFDAISHMSDQGTQLFSISFHSPSVEDGHTPYVRTEADLAAFYRWWDGLFAYLAQRNVTAASIEEVLEAAEQVRGRS